MSTFKTTLRKRAEPLLAIRHYLRLCEMCTGGSERASSVELYRAVRSFERDLRACRRKERFKMAFTENWCIDQYIRDGLLFTQCRMLLRSAILLSALGMDGSRLLRGSATRLYNLAVA